MWNATNGKQVRTLGENPESGPDIYGVYSTLVFSSDGKLASANFQGEVIIWDYNTGRKLRSPVAGNSRFINGIAFSPDGGLLAWNEGLHGICLWDVTAGRLRCQIPCVSRDPKSEDLVSAIRTFHFSPVGKVLMSAESDGHGSIHFWDTATGKEMPRGPDANRFWNNQAGRELLGKAEHEFLKETRLTLSPDGRALAVVTNRTIRMVSPDLKERQAHIGHESPVVQLEWSADGAIVASGDEDHSGLDKQVRTWDVRSSKPLQIFHKNSYYPFALSADGKRLTLSYPFALHDTFTGRELPMPAWAKEAKGLIIPSQRVYGESLALIGNGPNGLPLYLEIVQSELRLRTLEPSRRVGAFSVEDLPFSCLGDHKFALSKDRRLIAAVLAMQENKTDDKDEVRFYVTVRETRGGQEVARILRGPVALGSLTPEIALAPDGSVLAIGGDDGKIALYRLGRDKPFRELAGHRGFVTALAFSPDGSKLLSASEDTTMLIWDVANRPRRRQAELTPAELQRLWADLAARPASAHTAMQRLTAVPAQTLPFLKQHLQATAIVDAKQIAAWIVDLDSEDFAKRQQAEKELIDMAEQAEPALQEMLKRPISLEVNLRAERILAALNNDPVPAEEMRRHRAVAVLERIGSPAARDILEALAKGAPLAQQTLEAKAALERLAWSRKDGGGK